MDNTQSGSPLVTAETVPDHGGVKFNIYDDIPTVQIIELRDKIFDIFFLY